MCVTCMLWDGRKPSFTSKSFPLSVWGRPWQCFSVVHSGSCLSRCPFSFWWTQYRTVSLLPGCRCIQSRGSYLSSTFGRCGHSRDMKVFLNIDTNSELAVELQLYLKFGFMDRIELWFVNILIPKYSWDFTTWLNIFVYFACVFRSESDLLNCRNQTIDWCE